MAVTSIKALLFLAGGCAAAGTIAYVSGALDPIFTSPPATTAAAPEKPAEADAKDARLPGAEPPAAAAPEKPAEAGTPAAAAPETAAPAVLPPSFDVVRLEGDGSIVIAGKAVPNSKVELLVGSNVIGVATAGDGGDFAVVLEEPLKPGNYQIVLRSTAPDNVVAMSVETAVVSVPETKDGQVLALVEEPGKPSEMITLPKPEAPAATAQPAPPPAAAAPAAEPKPGEQVEAALTPPEPAPAEVPAAAVPAGPRVVVEAVEIDGRKIFVAGVADAGRVVRGYANGILLGDAKASGDGRFLIEAERDLPVGDYIIRVDALEPDGVKVAARAAVPFEREPGESIAAVAPVAPPAVVPAPAAETPPAGEAPAATPPATAQAPAGETAPAAVAAAPTAPAAPPAAAEAPAAAPATEAPATVAEAPAAPAAAGTAPATEAPAAIAEAPAAPATETPVAVAQAPAAPAEAGAPAAEKPAAVTEAPAASTPPATAEAPAGETPPAVAEAPATAPPATVEPPATAEAPAAAPAAEPAAPGTEIAAASPAEGEEMATPPPAGVQEVVSPKLQNVGSAVIIRRGDTLWRISHRVYGRGVRYSTIYLANQAQIEDPDRIWPGQVFKVPEKSDDGEAADMTRLGNRLTTAPK